MPVSGSSPARRGTRWKSAQRPTSQGAALGAAGREKESKAGAVRPCRTKQLIFVQKGSCAGHRRDFRCLLGAGSSVLRAGRGSLLSQEIR